MTKVTSTTLIKRQDNVPFKEIDNEGILLHLQKGDYFAVNEVGLFIWKSLNGTKTLEKIATMVSSRYKVNKDTTLADLLEFIKILNQRGLIAVCG